ncbi:MAG: ubiquinone/menaquinone biosynthesis methyltransferase [Gemmatimonadetes bacterium]|nr:ubiquinone/menaquinone biosynthesis methyltransferase [Gemmatimonadota bacterium]
MTREATQARGETPATGEVGEAAGGPLESGQHARADAVRRMFGAVAPRYDLLNHLLSLNIDRRWRRLAIDRLLDTAPHGGRYLDACAGTLDLAVELAGRSGFDGDVLAVDFALPMLERGRPKTTGRPIRIVCGDALSLPVRDATLDGATVGFGVRNLASLDAGLLEVARVLRPGAPLIILEFTTPVKQPLRALYLFYFRSLLPLIGRAISRHRDAYDYLPGSVLSFPPPRVLAQHLERCGFVGVSWESLTGGIAAPSSL